MRVCFFFFSICCHFVCSFVLFFCVRSFVHLFVRLLYVRLFVCLIHIFFPTALIPVSEDIRSRLKPGSSVTTPEPSPLGALAIKNDDNNGGSSLSVDSRVSIVITIANSPRPDDMPRQGNNFEWPTECQHLLLDPGVVNDNKTQALLLTTLVRYTRH